MRDLAKKRNERKCSSRDMIFQSCLWQTELILLKRGNFQIGIIKQMTWCGMWAAKKKV